ncbi:MAG TPA: polyprenyl diphosphate synthase [Candidatus Pelagibacter bacterium]|jgi:undecaprenyl diphosphate synthase|nr:polyprenyl diphosphate synthase [Candidatus Pelagibacter bacterium]
MSSPKHVAIIMDGNGRWGLKNKKSRNLGHKTGLKKVEKIIKSSIKNNIKYLTLYAFSTENWKRPKLEIQFLLNLLESFLKEKIEKLVKNGVKLKIIGDLKKFPKKIQSSLKSAQKKSDKNKKLLLILALNYGSKNELVNAIRKIKEKKMKINKSSVTKSLYTKGIPNPDLLIRTGNTNRLSNFLLWQLSYSEIFFVKKMWPDFNERDYKNVLDKFKKIKRNFGNI